MNLKFLFSNDRSTTDAWSGPKRANNSTVGLSESIGPLSRAKLVDYVGEVMLHWNHSYDKSILRIMRNQSLCTICEKNVHPTFETLIDRLMNTVMPRLLFLFT